MDPVPDPLVLRKCCRAGNRTRDLWVCTQEVRSLDYSGGPVLSYTTAEHSNTHRHEQAFLVFWTVSSIASAVSADF
jgi:hypothetical protein